MVYMSGDENRKTLRLYFPQPPIFIGMIRLKDLLNEKVTGVQWLDKAYNLAFNNHKIPMSPTIGNILNKGKRIRAFHVTSPEKLSQLNSLQGTKKSISCMTRVPDRLLNPDVRKIQGVWNSGVIFYLEGTLLLKARADIGSSPDEQGRRWVGLPPIHHNKWEKVVAKDEMLDKISKQIYANNAFGHPLRGKVKIEPKLLYKALFRYIELAEKFVKENNEGIESEFKSMKKDNWNELLLNDIELIDAIWDGNEGDRKEVKSKLESMVSGEVIAPKKYKNSDGKSFVKSRKVK
jgi:hypothetical protein